jgi:hypothetical protein
MPFLVTYFFEEYGYRGAFLLTGQLYMNFFKLHEKIFEVFITYSKYLKYVLLRVKKITICPVLVSVLKTFCKDYIRTF